MSNSQAWKGGVGYVLLGASLFVTYQGFQNQKVQPDTEVLAREIACAGDTRCVTGGERPHTIATDFFGRRYTWTKNGKDVSVSCQRSLVFAGAWRCHAGQP